MEPRDQTRPETIARWRAGARLQRGRRAGAGAEEPDVQRAAPRVRARPVDGRAHPLGEERDVEAQVAGRLVDAPLLGGQEVHEERGLPGVVEPLGDVAVAGAEAAAAAAVGEDHEP